MKKKLSTILLLIPLVWPYMVVKANYMAQLEARKDLETVRTIALFICVGVLPVSLIMEKIKRERIKTLTIEEIHELDPTFNINEFKKFAYDVFLKVQEACMNYDYDTLRNLLTDELYNTIVMQLETLKKQGEKKITSDFMLDKFGVINISKSNKNKTVEVLVIVSYKEYTVNSKDELLSGDKNKDYIVKYRLTFVKTIDSHDNICPNCGKELEQLASNKCPYCNSVILANSYDYVMSKKNKVSQR